MHDMNNHQPKALSYEEVIRLEPAVAAIIDEAGEERRGDWRSFESHKRRLAAFVGHSAADWRLSASGTYESTVRRLTLAMRI